MRTSYLAVATTLRDIIHETPLSQCDIGADTCPDWELAYEWADKVMAALDSAAPRKDATNG